MANKEILDSSKDLVVTGKVVQNIVESKVLWIG